MKILKIFGIVVGIHIFALILIFANPGCSSTSAPPPAPSDTIAKSEPTPPLNFPSFTPAPTAGAPASAESPVAFNPDAPATSAPAGGGVRFVPTRPGSPAAGTLVSEPVADVIPATTYTVVSGDNLSKIAKKVHVTVAELAAANHLSLTATLRPGQKLLVPGKPLATSAASPPGAVAPAARSAEPPPVRVPGEGLKHTVKSGETLGGIARKYDVRVADIAVANNIADPAKIRPGQELTIPGFTLPAGKAAKPAKAAPASPKSGDAAPAPAEPTPAAPLTPPATPIPVNPIDDNPLKPAPRP